MKLSKQRPLSKSNDSWYKKAEYKGCQAQICYDARFNIFYYKVAKNGDMYDSTWDNITYTTEKECIDMCELYINGLEA